MKYLNIKTLAYTLLLPFFVIVVLLLVVRNFLLFVAYQVLREVRSNSLLLKHGPEVAKYYRAQTKRTLVEFMRFNDGKRNPVKV